jgi:hypothetical protein
MFLKARFELSSFKVGMIWKIENDFGTLIANCIEKDCQSEYRKTLAAILILTIPESFSKLEKLQLSHGDDWLCNGRTYEVCKTTLVAVKALWILINDKTLDLFCFICPMKKTQLFNLVKSSFSSSSPSLLRQRASSGACLGLNLTNELPLDLLNQFLVMKMKL